MDGDARSIRAAPTIAFEVRLATPIRRSFEQGKLGPAPDEAAISGT